MFGDWISLNLRDVFDGTVTKFRNSDGIIVGCAKAFKLNFQNVRDGLSTSNRWPYQFAYGHREILLNYSGLPKNAYLLGDLQHGWSLPHSGPVKKTRDKWGKEAPHWLWEKQSEHLSFEFGSRKKIAIGAPWLYLLLLSGIQPSWGVVKNGPAREMLFIPTHHPPHVSRMENHQNMSARLKIDFFNESILVLLSMTDFLQAQIRESYEQNGFRVACAGSTGYPYRYPVAPYADGGDRIQFLPNILSMLNGVSAVITNGVGTHIFYAASLGLPVFGWPLKDAEKEETLRRYSNSSERSEVRAIFDFERDSLNMREDGWLNQETLVDVSRMKLGYEAIVGPEELRSKLRWSLIEEAAGNWNLRLP